MKASLLTVCVLAAGALAAPACGGGSGKTDGAADGGTSDNCAQVQPCGGDVVGTWIYRRACPSATAYTQQAATVCPGSSASAYSQTISGSITFNADLTFSFNDVSETLAATTISPTSCLSNVGCAEQDRHETEANGTIDVTCTGTTTCTCQTDVSVTRLSLSGTYSVARTTLTMVSGQTTTVTSYCVEGTRLHQISAGTVSGPSGQPVILNDVVAER